MNRQLKERLIGAIVVVTLGVLIIPEFLSGPDETSTVSVDIDLPAASHPETRTYTFRLDEPAATPSTPVPAPAVSVPVAEEQETPPEQTVALTETQPAEASEAVSPPPVPAPALKPPPQSGPAAASEQGEANWVVQLGSFSSKENAQRLSAQLKAKGYPSFVTEYTGGVQILHRVRVGPAGTREQAETLARRLKDQGQSVKVVPQL